MSIPRRPSDLLPLLGRYPEDVWVALLGPAAIVGVRRLERLRRAFPDGLTVELAALAPSLGLHPHRLEAALDRLGRAGLVVRTTEEIGLSGYAPVMSDGQLQAMPALTRLAHAQLTRSP